MKNTTMKDISPSELEVLLREAAVQEGACIPQTPRELKILEEKLTGKTFVLPKFSELLARLRGRTPELPNVINAKATFDHDVTADLAMAARNGGDIPADLRAKMDADRADAEARKTN